MDLIYNIILLILTLIVLVITYGIILRTSGCFKKGIMYIFASILLIAIKWILDILNNGNSAININIIYIVFLILILLGLLNIKRCIQAVNGETHLTKKVIIKKKRK